SAGLERTDEVLPQGDDHRTGGIRIGVLTDEGAEGVGDGKEDACQLGRRLEGELALRVEDLQSGRDRGEVVVVVDLLPAAVPENRGSLDHEALDSRLVSDLDEREPGSHELVPGGFGLLRRSFD